MEVVYYRGWNTGSVSRTEQGRRIEEVDIPEAMVDGVDIPKGMVDFVRMSGAMTRRISSTRNEKKSE